MTDGSGRHRAFDSMHGLNELGMRNLRRAGGFLSDHFTAGGGGLLRPA